MAGARLAFSGAPSVNDDAGLFTQHDARRGGARHWSRGLRFATRLAFRRRGIRLRSRLFLDKTARAKKCEAMAGLSAEGDHVLEEAEDEAVRDAGIIGAAQAVEHYEIARYGTLAAWAKLLGMDDAVSLLEETLEEEKAADETLSGIAERSIRKPRRRRPDFPEADRRRRLAVASTVWMGSSGANPSLSRGGFLPHLPSIDCRQAGGPRDSLSKGRPRARSWGFLLGLIGCDLEF
jgi:hypothetical protein